MPSTFLPRQESKLDRWLENFSTQISAAPAQFGLSLSDAESIAVAVAEWHAAYVTAREPSTRTISAVCEKNTQKKIVLPLVRCYAAIIRANPNVDGAQDIALGLHPRRPPGQRGSIINAPQEKPTLALTKLSVGSHTIRISRHGLTGRSCRPRGAAGLLLFRAIADEPTMSTEEARFVAFVTRAEYRAEFPLGEGLRGKTATYFARWTNFKGELGPWSTATSMQIAA